jgi:hypothetical protein
MSEHKLSNDSLLALHDACKKAYHNDMTLTETEKLKAVAGYGLYFETDVYRDWPAHVKSLEADLNSRGINFTPVRLR